MSDELLFELVEAVDDVRWPREERQAVIEALYGIKEELRRLTDEVHGLRRIPSGGGPW